MSLELRRAPDSDGENGGSSTVSDKQSSVLRSQPWGESFEVDREVLVILRNVAALRLKYPDAIAQLVALRWDEIDAADLLDLWESVCRG